jgi:hypothetical protein
LLAEEDVRDFRLTEIADKALSRVESIGDVGVESGGESSLRLSGADPCGERRLGLPTSYGRLGVVWPNQIGLRETLTGMVIKAWIT